MLKKGFPNPQTRRRADLIKGWIDTKFYLEQNKDLQEHYGHKDELAIRGHYIKYGWKEGRQPNIAFESGYYKNQTSARGLTIPKGISPLEHFIRHGIELGISPSDIFQSRIWRESGQNLRKEQAPNIEAIHAWGGYAKIISRLSGESAATILKAWIENGLHPGRIGPQIAGSWFDNVYYRGKYQDIEDEGKTKEDLLLHYLLYGWKEGRKPSPYFDPEYYLQELSKRGLTLKRDQSPLEHYVEEGKALAIKGTPLFASHWWINSRERTSTELPALKEIHPWGEFALTQCGNDEHAATQLLEEWIEKGLHADRAGPDLTKTWFDANYYIETNKDLVEYQNRRSQQGALMHYLLFGWKEGRQPHFLFNAKYYCGKINERGLKLEGDESPLEHYLRMGIKLSIGPNELLENQGWPNTEETELQKPPSLESIHPWGEFAISRFNDKTTAELAVNQWILLGLGSERARPEEIRDWFDAEFYKASYPDLVKNYEDLTNDGLLLHYVLYGWKENRQPGFYFDQDYYINQLEKLGYNLPENISVLEHYIKEGRGKGLKTWKYQQIENLREPTDPNGSQIKGLCKPHHLEQAAVDLAKGYSLKARNIMTNWLNNGISIKEMDAIMANSNVDGKHKAIDQLGTIEEFKFSEIISNKELSESWKIEGWLAKEKKGCRQGEGGPNIVIVLILLAPGKYPEQSDIKKLLSIHNVAIADTDLKRCGLWQYLGLRAYNIEEPNKQELDEHFKDVRLLHELEKKVGLPNPEMLENEKIICLGEGENSFNMANNREIAHIPGFYSLEKEYPEMRKNLAAWLWKASRSGKKIVELCKNIPNEQTLNKHLEWLKTETFQVLDLDKGTLIRELEWREGAYRNPIDLQPESPQTEMIWEKTAVGEAKASIAISLYNYEGRIIKALESAIKQSCSDIEIIIVDDCSSDNSLEKVKTWLEENEQELYTAKLLRHQNNAGLATARNTGIEASTTEWVFILDADNELDSNAVDQCLDIANKCSEKVAVVHPLIRTKKEGIGEAMNDLGIISVHSWQKERFAQYGNFIDAMALIRKSAWKSVGGYHHIPGGWEDFDYWCKIVEAGFHGVICPNAVATYTVHPDSMIQTSTKKNKYAISRLISKRHPWVRLPHNQSI